MLCACVCVLALTSSHFTLAAPVPSSSTSSTPTLFNTVTSLDWHTPRLLTTSPLPQQLRLGTTDLHPKTMSLHVGGLAIDLTQKTGIFAPTYKEVHVAEDNTFHVTATKARDEHCYYTGHVRGEAETSSVHVLACTEQALEAFIHRQGQPALHLEPAALHSLAKQDTQGEHTHVLYQAMEYAATMHARESNNNNNKDEDVAPSSGSTCLPGATGHLSRSVLAATHQSPAEAAFKLQATDECTNNPSKTVQVLIVNDYYHTQLRGEDTESFAATVFANTKQLFADGNFACTIDLQLGTCKWLLEE